MPEEYKRDLAGTLNKNRATTENLEISSNRLHHEATNNQWFRCNPGNSGSILRMVHFILSTEKQTIKQVWADCWQDT